jgi:hypothetical protein
MGESAGHAGARGREATMGIVKTAAAALQIDDRELARRLGVSPGALRQWDRCSTGAGRAGRGA